ncbi:uncharacterized protein PADG_06963 [Paracoccidioides brasiliensis Pb18]|uniref:J domain-containing protein n=1 Tax=Paracoccidioides brasiliensis (strain Pb18) TaxID=502780 RepID=C1GI77_PARBD|nr:uncharacterized protein PADG_06963 [Paracoccidioides brasiliensis Pb18]EEH42143.1 hypothetical protein PADG_06963 [Paracoccidioides brasiliensis Pb18]ODH49172.1 hypothetical protein GX48_04679 [Paracoccidioides brasiliensis]
MPSREDELMPDEPPSSINPYEVLGVDEAATADQIKSAYRKQALKHHPDKAPPTAKESAHKKFQELAFAYAILSDPRRRRRYDTTGSTAETLHSLNDDDDDFNWIDFFRQQFATVIDGAAIDKIKSEYQGSEQEREDLLAAYERWKGDLDKVYEEVMLSNVLEDDKRFREIIDGAIAEGKVEGWPKYTAETERRRVARIARVRKEAEEAEKVAGELGVVKGKGKGKGGMNKGDEDGGADLNGLAALIQQRQKSRAATFLDDLEARYAPAAGSKGGNGPGSKGKKRKGRHGDDKPPEEAFLATANRKATKKRHV